VSDRQEKPALVQVFPVCLTACLCLVHDVVSVHFTRRNFATVGTKKLDLSTSSRISSVGSLNHDWIKPRVRAPPERGRHAESGAYHMLPLNSPTKAWYRRLAGLRRAVRAIPPNSGGSELIRRVGALVHWLPVDFGVISELLINSSINHCLIIVQMSINKQINKLLLLLSSSSSSSSRLFAQQEIQMNSNNQYHLEQEWQG